MAFRVFQYPLPTAPELAELNAFLANHPIATVQREIVHTSAGPMLVFVVESATAVPRSNVTPGSPTSRVDYREVLDPGQFELFSRLRNVRKRLADALGVPVYAICGNSHLAAMVQRQVTTAAQMLEIPGIGQARVEKYAAEFLAVLLNTPTAQEGVSV